MRDIKRISIFMMRLEELWVKAPDLRFGQMVELIKGYSTIDLWSIEDENFIEALEKLEKELEL